MIQESLRRHRRRKRMLLGILVAIVLLAAIATVRFIGTYLTEFTVTGNVYLPQETVTDMLFETQMEKRYYYARWRDALGKKKQMPMIQNYRLTFEGTKHVIVEITENPPVGGIPYVDSYLYFDEDGYILCSAREALEGIPVVNGITFRQPRLYQQLLPEEEEAFERQLAVLRLLKSYGIEGDRLVIDENGNSVFAIGDIRVNLGNDRFMQEKISELRSILTGSSILKLEGLKGVLHMENYTSSDRTDSNYIFERD